MFAYMNLIDLKVKVMVLGPVGVFSYLNMIDLMKVVTVVMVLVP